MVTTSETNITVTMDSTEALGIINEIDNVITKLNSCTVSDLNEIKTLMTLKNALVLELA